MSVDVEALTATVRGPVLQPGGDGYDEERAGFQAGFQHRPAVIVGATGAEDVRAAVRFAAERGLPVAVQSTGHGIVTALDGDGVLITTRRMAGLELNAEARTVRGEAGVRWEQVIREAARHGLAPLNGSAPHVGVVGYLLGGGTGLLGREFGYASDHVHAIELVTADGTLRRVTAGSDPDLFWALRGGAGNFGVVTAIETSLFPVARFYGGGLYFEADSPVEVLRAYREWTLTVPEQLTSSIGLMGYPPIPAFPKELQGRYVAHVRIAFNGDTAEGERLVAPLRALGPRLIDTLREMPYEEAGSVYHDPDFPHAYFGGNVLLRELDPTALQTLMDLAGPDSAVPCIIDIRHLGGAFARRPAQPSAVGGREAQYILRVMTGGVPAPADSVRPVHQRVYDAMKQWAVGRSPGFVYHDGTPVNEEQVRELFDADAYERLARIKALHDPDNLFRFTHNIKPADGN
ncbi:FAD-binding oxidoreductase [Streptantibioticus ferralitis]|uniref:FAD-binding oxidoreductase n=1 Tax=Streptantibioticus ferralitis TaxID=236510 RepID=A0ABT5YV44_9ACTN|nr:FAD-binding oxidoreductase [Streptantibioticus ferralitis]MDF2255487.1 FAD-binding oxidoreductase [Streptantibioticus ferralitis]